MHRLSITPAPIVMNDMVTTSIAWKNMIRRCHVPRAHNYVDYGGRGILVCDRWHKFENFVHDMGTNPPGLSIDRYPDNNDGYKPENCRWATRHQQQRNIRSNVLLTHNGKTQTMVEWANDLGITRHALWSRLNRHNVPLELALSAKGDARNLIYNRKQRVMVSYKGIQLTLAQACKLKGISYGSVRQRLHRTKLTPQEAFDLYLVY